MEYRAFRAESVTASENGHLTGLVTPFGRETVIGDPSRGGFREEVAPGCFTKTLGEGDALMVYQHDLAKPLARKSAGNLELAESASGLEVDAVPVDTTYARDLRALVEAGVIRGMSFGFNVVKDDWFDDSGAPSNRHNGTRRVLREVQLIEVSPVTRPAYQGTSISARDEVSALLEERAGASKSKPYGDVAYADPKNGKYPVDTAEHARAAWAYINKAKNAAVYPLNGVTLDSVKAKIRAALKKFGVHVSADEKKWFSEDDFQTREDIPAEWLILAEGDDRALFDADAGDESGAGDDPEGRDDPDGKEYAAIDSALEALSANPPDVKRALSVLRANKSSRDEEQKPESSTSADTDASFALRARATARLMEFA